MNSLQINQLRKMYENYRNIIKPLIAEIEANYEQFPQPIFNEIRAFNDHVSRCFIDNCSEQEINKQLDKANSHITRMILDCYKYLNVYYHSRIELFEKQTKHIDITMIDNGKFYPKYCDLRNQIVESVKNAKNNEYADGTINYKLFETSYNQYTEMIDFLDEHVTQINWAKAKYVAHKGKAFLIWIIGIILGAILTNNNQALLDFIKSIFQ